MKHKRQKRSDNRSPGIAIRMSVLLSPWIDKYYACWIKQREKFGKTLSCAREDNAIQTSPGRVCICILHSAFWQTVGAILFCARSKLTRQDAGASADSMIARAATNIREMYRFCRLLFL